MNGAEDTTNLPIAGNFAGNPTAAGPLLPFSKWQLINIGHLEDLWRVETCAGTVAPQDIRIIPVQSGPTIVVSPVDGLGPGVGSLNHQSMTELAVDGNLERIVVSTQESLPEQGARSPIPELWLIIGLSSCRLSRERSVYVNIGELVNCVCPHVSSRYDEARWKLALYDEVPRLNIAPLQLTWPNAAFKRLGRERNCAAADVGAANGRNTCRKRPCR